MSEPLAGASELAAQLEVEIDALLAESAGLPAELVRWKPAPDVWSVMEILCHVAEIVPYWTSQAVQIVRRPDAEWGRTHADAARLEAVRQADSRSLADVLDEIGSSAEKSVARIREFRDTDLVMEAMSRNPRWARKPVSFVVKDLLIQHVGKHLGQILRNVKQFHESGLTDSVTVTPTSSMQNRTLPE